MNTFNSYLAIMISKEKRKKDLAKKNIKLINCKYLNEIKNTDNNFQIMFTQKNSNRRNINYLNNREMLSGAKTTKKFRNTYTECYDEKTDKDNSIMSFYDGTHKKININKNNSIAYTKKRPNDLIKNTNLNRSTIVSTYQNNTFKKNGRCFSCTDIKMKSNLLNNDRLKRNVSFYKDNISSIKKVHFQIVNPFVINDFSFKNRDDFPTRKIISELASIILKIMKKHLMTIRALFFQKMKNNMKFNSYKISLREYKLLEELKSLGVSNVKELNLLLNDIYSEIKANN